MATCLPKLSAPNWTRLVNDVVCSSNSYSRIRSPDTSDKLTAEKTKTT